MMKFRILTSGETDDGHPVLQRLDDDVLSVDDRFQSLWHLRFLPLG